MLPQGYHTAVLWYFQHTFKYHRKNHKG